MQLKMMIAMKVTESSLHFDGAEPLSRKKSQPTVVQGFDSIAALRRMVDPNTLIKAAEP